MTKLGPNNIEIERGEQHRTNFRDKGWIFTRGLENGHSIRHENLIHYRDFGIVWEPWEDTINK